MASSHGGAVLLLLQRHMLSMMGSMIPRVRGAREHSGGAGKDLRTARRHLCAMPIGAVLVCQRAELPSEILRELLRPCQHEVWTRAARVAFTTRQV